MFGLFFQTFTGCQAEAEPIVAHRLIVREHWRRTSKESFFGKQHSVRLFVLEFYSNKTISFENWSSVCGQGCHLPCQFTQQLEIILLPKASRNGDSNTNEESGGDTVTPKISPSAAQQF